MTCPAAALLRLLLPAGCALSLGLLFSGVSAQAQIGEFGADLRALRRFYVPPRSEHESNHYFDLFGGARVYQAMLNQGLTNNRALIVLSHGKGIVRYSSLRYGYYPDERVWDGEKAPYFSAADLAQVIGEKAAARIHNIMIAGCNKEDAFDARELRRYFANATNITHSLGGKDGYELVFRHTLMHASSDMRLLYASDFKAGGLSPAARARKLGFAPYLSELFRPGEAFAYATQIAGRELLQPSILGNISSEPAEVRLAEAAIQIATATRRKDTAVAGGGATQRSPRTGQSALPAQSPAQNPSSVIRWHATEPDATETAVASSGVVRWQAGVPLGQR